MNEEFHFRFLVPCNAKKILRRFDTNFETKMMMKIYATEIIFKSHEAFQSYQPTGPTEPAILAELAEPLSWFLSKISDLGLTLPHFEYRLKNSKCWRVKPRSDIP